MVYRGPVFLDFEIPIAIKREQTSQNQQVPLTDGQLDVDAESIHDFDGGMLKLSQIGYDLDSSMMNFAFPHLNELWREHEEDMIEGSIDTELRSKIREAALRDLKPYIQTSWRIKNMERSDDPVDQIARTHRTSPEVIKQFVPKNEHPDKPKTPRKPKPRRLQSPKRKKKGS